MACEQPSITQQQENPLCLLCRSTYLKVSHRFFVHPTLFSTHLSCQSQDLVLHLSRSNLVKRSHSLSLSLCVHTFRDLNEGPPPFTAPVHRARCIGPTAATACLVLASRHGEAGRVYFYQNELPYDVDQVRRCGRLTTRTHGFGAKASTNTRAWRCQKGLKLEHPSSIIIYELRSKRAKTTVVKRGRFVHKALQNN